MHNSIVSGTVRVREIDGEIVSARLEDLAEFVPIGSPEHRAMVDHLRDAAKEIHKDGQDGKLRILPVETPESKLVGREEKDRTLWYLVWALARFWMAVLLAGIWRKL